MKVKKFKKNKGVLIFITGLSGSGKSSIAKKIYPLINKMFGPTILINGDDLRKIFKLYGFSSKDRLENSKKFAKIFKIITKQNISILFAAIGMRHKTRSIFKKSVQNYFEIYIQASLKKIKKKIKKKYISDLNHKDSIPFIVSGSIDPYKYLRNKKVRFMKKDYNQAFIRKTKDSVIAKSKWDFYEKEKIIIAGMTKRVEAIYFHDPIGLGVGIYGIYEFGDYDKYALLGLLNSKFMTYYVKKKFKDVHLAGGYLAINKNLIQEYPLPNNPNKDKLKLISELAKKLNLHTNIDDNIMHEIDILVYELYGLNKKEIDLINHLTI